MMSQPNLQPQADAKAGVPTQYAERDPESQGDYYMRHLSAMTGERLHDKSAIAGELAHRDIQIDALRSQLAAIQSRPAGDGTAGKSLGQIAHEAYEQFDGFPGFWDKPEMEQHDKDCWEAVARAVVAASSKSVGDGELAGKVKKIVTSIGEGSNWSEEAILEELQPIILAASSNARRFAEAEELLKEATELFDRLKRKVHPLWEYDVTKFNRKITDYFASPTSNDERKAG
jgi:hypothetical protein